MVSHRTAAVDTRMQESKPPSSVSLLSGAGDYEVVDGDVTTACADVVRVWGNTVGWPGRQEEGYRSYYLDPSVERPLLKLLRHVPSNRIVGTVGISPRRVMWRGREIRAGVFSHLCVEKAHRKIRPAKLLIAVAVDACRRRFDLAYGMPRTDEANAFMRLLGTLGWRLACSGSRRVRVLRYTKYVGRLLPRPLAIVAGRCLDAAMGMRDAVRGRADRVVAQWTERVDPRMAALWRAVAPGDGWVAVRDEAMLRWRFDGLVSFRRGYLLVSDANDGLLVAWFACDANPSDPEILVVEDFWSRQGANAIDPQAIRVLCREVRSRGYCAVEMRLAASDSCFASWRAEGFAKRNGGDTYVCWLNREVQGDGVGPYYFTEFDNDG